jgi:hypothetical protein
MSTIVKNIHIFKDGAWHPIKKVFKDSAWRTMKGIFYQGVWYEIGATCVVMPDGCAISTTVHPRWNENTTNYGTNNFGFNILPAGYRDTSGGYTNIGGGTMFITSYSSSPAFSFNYGGIQSSYTYDHSLGSVRCCKNSSEDDFTVLTNAYIDGDGNYYDAIVINGLAWTLKNLYTTKYQNGTDITFMSNWNNLETYTEGAYCYPQNDFSYVSKYQLLYNRYAVNSGLVGGDWFIPTYTNWATDLLYYLINTNWCNDVTVTNSNVAQFLKSCRQVNHPLA